MIFRGALRGCSRPVVAYTLAPLWAITMGVGCGVPSLSSQTSDASSPTGDGAPEATPIADDDASSLDAGDDGVLRPDSDADAAVGDAAPSNSGGDGATPGVRWPIDRSFPTFPAVESLDVADISSARPDEQYLYVSLEGIVNRTQPRIYLRDSAADHEDAQGKPFWLGLTNIPTRTVVDPMTLITKYRTEIAGIVIYDDNPMDAAGVSGATANLATAIAGIEGGLVASPELAATLTAAPYGLPVMVDLRSNAFTSPDQVYEYELATYQSRATDRMIMGLDPARTDSLRDYAIATNALVVWLDPTKPADLQVLNAYLAKLQPNSPYMGWWTDEPTGVGAASSYGVPTFAADWSRNLTVFSGIPTEVMRPAPPPPPPLQNKAYIAIFMSDGDNLQEDQHLIPLKWADPARGHVPISWTVQPGLVDVAPMMLEYFYVTATPNDVLVSGPSGLGYTYPRDWPATIFPQYAARSSEYLSRAGLGVITVWNNGPSLSSTPSEADDYAAGLPHLLGVTDQAGGGGTPTLLGQTLPLLEFASGYANSEAELENGIDAQLAGWSKSAPLFVAVQGDMNQAAISPAAFVRVQSHYASNANVVFVRGDHLFQLIRKQMGLSTNP